MIEIEKSSGNVYADLDARDAASMLLKAKLASKISEIIQKKKLTQIEAAKILGLPQPKVSAMLRGHFRGISEAKMIECLNRLGRNVEIVVRRATKRQSAGLTSVAFA